MFGRRLAGESPSLAEQGQATIRERHPMLRQSFHPCRGNRPNRVVEINLVPCRPAYLPRPRRRQHEKQRRPLGAAEKVAEGQGFEPWEALTSLVFKTSAFVHSATPPKGVRFAVERMRGGDTATGLADGLGELLASGAIIAVARFGGNFRGGATYPPKSRQGKRSVGRRSDAWAEKVLDADTLDDVFNSSH